MTPWFIATERFTPDAAESWSTYIAWSHLTQLKEVVSLDPMLCPPVLRTIKDEYWPYIVNEDFMLNFFVDFPYLLKQVAGIQQKNILCVFRNPPSQPTAPAAASFEFLGYDLVDTMGNASVLTNCGGFPNVFSNAELSAVGLLPSLDRACQVQTRLRALHPEEPHANCHVWAIFRFIES